MSAKIVVGLQLGDEAKGRIVDYLSKDQDLVCRYNGGGNAGHTIIVDDKKTVLNHIPSGAIYPHTICVLTQGMVIDPFALVDEIQNLEAQGIDLSNRLWISNLAHLVLPYHKLVESLREGLASTKIGTTKRGIGPCYEDKIGRRGVRVGDLFDDHLEDKVYAAMSYWGTHLKLETDRFELLFSLRQLKYQLAPFVNNTSSVINMALRQGKKVLFEGAQGALLDIDHGIYPYVTSSNCIAGGVCTGAGVGPNKIQQVVGVAKAYLTRVGEGPFVTELLDEVGESIRQKGKEYGSVTGRSRRVGWLDLPALKYAVEINGADTLALTKVDILSGLEEIKYCTEYTVCQSASVTKFNPALDFSYVSPSYQTLPGWEQPLQDLTRWQDLPVEARNYVELIETEVGVPINLISVGPERHQIIVKE